MSINVGGGDTVHALCWGSFCGPFAEEYKLLEIAHDHIVLRHIATYRRDGRHHGHGGEGRRPLLYLQCFQIPLAECIQEQRAFIDGLVSCLSQR